MRATMQKHSLLCNKRCKECFKGNIPGINIFRFLLWTTWSLSICFCSFTILAVLPHSFGGFHFFYSPKMSRSFELFWWGKTSFVTYGIFIMWPAWLLGLKSEIKLSSVAVVIRNMHVCSTVSSLFDMAFLNIVLQNMVYYNPEYC